jgi:pimeloyl-ACP methyl ester carboxylesterase
MNTEAERHESTIVAGDTMLRGWLEIPPGATGIVVFVHGSGSSRFSSRNNAVAGYLREGRLGTLLFDLLTSDEERIDTYTREYRFDIPLLSQRLADAIRWLREQPQGADLPLGLFGSSTGAAAALIVAARMPGQIDAVVSRGGRVDLAGEYLGKVEAPTLMIVGGADHEVLRLNRAAREQLHGIVEIAIVEGASHLFEEPGALQQVANLTRDWFVDQLGRDSGATAPLRHDASARAV